MSKHGKLMAHWHDAGNLLLGAWLLFSPFVLGFNAEPAAALNAYITGGAIALVAAGAFYAYYRWEEWANGLLAIWLMASPWALGYTALSAATYNAVFTGFLVLMLAFGAVMAEDHSGRRTA